MESLAYKLPYRLQRPLLRAGGTLRTVQVFAKNVDNLAVETELLMRVRDAQDANAFDRLFNALGSKVLGYLTRSGGCSPDDGENVLQEVWLTVWTRAQSFDPSRASAHTWIFALARNAMIDLKRSQSREYRVFVRTSEDHEDPVDNELNHSGFIDSEKTAALLDQIPPEQAQVLLMAYVEGKSHREIARELGLPSGTVKSRLRLGFSRLRGMLEGTTA
ncbi:MAG: sigma-70 family RNA polymerase sigma factor [Gammaproteobacteria bacterium]|nr:sigma-70 family RNA polymerase sigma factor [Gammaproteobacteria bacterium]